jgi:LysM repeat protein
VITLLEYIVRPGDTLSKIASQYGVSPEFILSANPSLGQEPLPAGIKIIIPISRQFEEFREEIRPTH